MKKKIGNPLIKRIPRELATEWRKYLVVALFLILTIGFISGMYVANNSMMSSITSAQTTYNLEYGHFELDKAISDKTIEAIETGEKADIHQYFLDEAKKELDEKFKDEFDKEFNTKFNEEFDKEFDSKFKTEFDKEFKTSFDKQFKTQFTKEFKSSFNKEFEKSFASEFDTQFEAQVYNSLLEQGLDEETANSMLSDAVSEAKSNGTYKTAYDEALKQAKKSSDYTSAYNKAYKTAYNKAYPSAYKKAYNSAYPSAYKEAYNKAYTEAYDEAYQEAYDEAYAEAWDEVKEEVEEEYAKVVDKYELDDADAPVVPVTLYENYFRNAEEDLNADGEADGSIRVYKQTDYINQACIIEGSLPANENEIAIDRMHANNASIEVGDEISVSGTTYTVSGLIAYVNYTTLHEKNTDVMFDAIKFDVAMVTEEGFDRITTPVHYAYAWDYVDTPADDTEEKTQSENFLKALITQAAVADREIEDYLPRYANQAVQFAPEDMGSDMAMGGVLLYILTVIIAFIFAVTISNTIQKEASAIGTLRASGYSKGELIRFYISMPVIVTLLSALIGNVLGYTVFKNTVISMYYNSYSLPAYTTLWNSDAFVKTTVVPVVLMFVVNLAIITYRMQLSPLKFLRHDLKRFKQKKAMRLPNISFLGRFRLRIILQNLPNFLVLFLGVFFVALMLAMAVGMPSTLDYYKENTSKMMFADYQYVLTSYEDDDENVIKTSNEDAKKFDMTSLMYTSDSREEEISVYGISEESAYVQIDGFTELADDEVYVSDSFAAKYGLDVGSSFTLDDKYENENHTFTVAGLYDKSFSLSVFMPISHYETVFDLDDGEFTGFLSSSEITDIDEDYIATVIDEEDITKLSDQMDHSMGAYMTYFQYLCVLLSAVLIYLLTKLIIEKNEVSISMIKILGYTNGDIFRLYILATTIVVIIADAISVYLGALAMKNLWTLILMDMSGWFDFVMAPVDYFRMFAYIFAGYLIVLFFDFRRIKKIPMDQALKNVE